MARSQGLQPLAGLLAVFLVLGATPGAPDRGESATRLNRLIEEKGLDGAVASIEPELEENGADQAAVDMLQLLIAGAYPLAPEESSRLRKLVRRHARTSNATLVPPGESGQPLVMDGVVTDSDGRPVSGALLYVYQTDARGFYTPRDEQSGRMNEEGSRLFAYLRTDERGRFRFRTVRPGGYPDPRGDVAEDHPRRFIPQHVHVDIEALGYAERALQLVFEDDPRMNAEWRRWAERGGHPIVKLAQRDGSLYGSVAIALEPTK